MVTKWYIDIAQTCNNCYVTEISNNLIYIKIYLIHLIFKQDFEIKPSLSVLDPVSPNQIELQEIELEIVSH